MNETQILFSEVKIGNYNIKGWSFGFLFTISDLLAKVIDKAEARGLVEELNNSGGIIPYTTFAKLFSVAGPEVLEIIALTLNISQDEVKALSMEDGLKIAFTIYNQNKNTIVGSLKKAFSLALTEEENTGSGAVQN